ncbi:uncharacterized protein LOC6538466 isoform X1 [Drosophila yakuba]|uniref:Uncharacterized protein n=1 Tax=Drosophila yakuba TaxID=7245 RepID=B4PT15_DROYA|nr:uncharacterized protein LOC6538466 isoform X1 [Drosophila yakuba]EDW98702.1 uncharacterized protein Dyak_GE10661 [Drosophila yakuba]
MNCIFLICSLLGISFVIAIEANCLRGTGHMWQLKPPTGTNSCNRPSSLARNGTSMGKPMGKPATSAVDIAVTTMVAPDPEVGATVAAPPVVFLANYVYECASRRTASSCSKPPGSKPLPEPESKPELESGQEPEVPKPRTVTLTTGELEGFGPTE